jgi:hypothetical protein
MGLEDLVRVIQLLSNIPRTSNQHQRQQGYPVGSGAGTASILSSLFNLQPHRGSTATGARSDGAMLVAEDDDMLEVVQDTEPLQQPQGPPTSISRYVLWQPAKGSRKGGLNYSTRRGLPTLCYCHAHFALQ